MHDSSSIELKWSADDLAVWAKQSAQIEDHLPALLDWLRPGGPWVLTAISPDGPTTTRTFTDLERTAAWIKQQNQTRNLHYQANPTRAAISSKATKRDIARVEFLHVDCDPDDGETADAFKARMLPTLEAFAPRPTVIVDSGNGLQALWQLTEPASCDTDEQIAEIEARNQALAAALGAPAGTHNIDRLLRLPGTINWPNNKKRNNGRVATPSRLVLWTGLRHSLSAFPREASTSAAARAHTTSPPRLPADLPLLEPEQVAGLDEFTKTLLRTGDDLERPRDKTKARYKSRSEALWGALCRLIRADCNNLTIAGLVLNPKLKISEVVLEKPTPRDFVAKQITKARAMVAASSALPDLGKNGRPLATLANTKAALVALGIECRHNIFSLRYEVGGHVIDEFAGEVQDPAIHELRSVICDHFGFEPSKQSVLDAVQTLANQYRYHPVRDYLDSLQWDGVSRINNWLITYCGAEDDEFNRTVSTIVLIAAVRRVRQPGCKFDEMLVLESPEGRDKSELIRMLAVNPEWFTDQMDLKLKGRETIEQSSGKWLCEIPELQGMRKAEIEQVKAWLSRRIDRGRMAYAMMVMEAKRQFIPIGTTNSSSYLRSQEGNRRFWPASIQRCDLKAIERDRDQLWAEAATRESAGDSIRLPEHLWAVAAEKQSERTVENPLFQPLASLLGNLEGKVTTENLWRGLGIPVERQPSLYSDLGNAMRDLGWISGKKFRVAGSVPLRGFIKGEEPRRPIVCHPPDKSTGAPGLAEYGDEESETPQQMNERIKHEQKEAGVKI